MADRNHDIEKYLRGELSPAEMHALEKAALDDPFLADALAGAEQLNATDFAEDVSHLKEKILRQKKRTVLPFALRMAASIALIIASGFVVWMFLDKQPDQQLALEQHQSQNVQPLADTVNTIPAPTLREETLSDHPVKDQPQPIARQKSAVAKSDVVTENASNTLALRTDDTLRNEDELIDKPIEAAPAKSIARENIPQASKPEQGETKNLAKELETKKKESVTRGNLPGYLQNAQDAAPAISLNVIEGRVTSAEDGSPLPGVSVVIKGSTIGTHTDANGFYHIETASPNATLQYAFIGMRTAEVKVDKTNEVNVKLEEDGMALSEVVVTGYGTRRANQSIPVTVEAPYPVNGNREFKKYLDANVRYPEEAVLKKTEGRVIVEFTVNYDSTLSDFTIIRGIGNGCDEELIRLIKEGPKWTPAKSNNFAVSDKVRVRFKFELPKK